MCVGGCVWGWRGEGGGWVCVCVIEDRFLEQEVSSHITAGPYFENEVPAETWKTTGSLRQIKVKKR